MSYVRLIAGVTDTRYYGLVHELNRANSPSDTPDDVLFKVTENWRTFGMEGRVDFDPSPGVPSNFGNAHMLVSTDDVFYDDAHNTVVKDVYCTEPGEDEDGNPQCKTWGTHGIDNPVGYEPAWQCILGTGHSSASQRPVALTGPDQTRECTGNGGAFVVLDGSPSEDADCDVLHYTWTGPFREARVRNPNIFLPLGRHTAELVVEDDWQSSSPATTSVDVVDTQPPSLRVTLTPTVTPNRRLIRIDANINVADSCGGTRPRVALTSITSDQADTGTGDGDSAGDIQGARFGTFDRSFLVPAVPGRTYTVTYRATDASGNHTQTAATVRVPQPRR